MPEEVKKLVTYDVDGYDIVTKALETVLNTFPGLQPTEKIKFSFLKEDDGIAFYPVSGAVVASEKKSVTGMVDQLCNYPFLWCTVPHLQRLESRRKSRNFWTLSESGWKNSPCRWMGKNII